MATQLTEERVRERVNLSDDHNLDDVRSMALPGTYHEKIWSLGDSLKHFTRLRVLDLSRNAIESLEGLVNLKLLETLNLYYNNISDVDELYRLRANSKLQDLDLRLNPIARTEPDYRLILVHMLPNLRNLDDRAVRDLERKAALMHFGTSQAAQMSDSVQKWETVEQRPNPRVEHVRSLGRSPFCAEEDTEALLSHVKRANSSNVRGKVFTGSNAQVAKAEDYPADDVRQMNLAYVDSHAPDDLKQSVELLTRTRQSKHGTDSQGQIVNSLPSGVDPKLIQQKYPNLFPIVAASAGSAGSVSTKPEHSSDQRGESYRQNAARDGNLQYSDELDAYTSYKAVGHFTPNPVADQMNMRPKPASVEFYASTHQVPPAKGGSNSNRYHREHNVDDLPASVASLTDSETIDQCVDNSDADNAYERFVSQISELVDKYWNGSKSLLKNKRFRKSVTELLRGLQPELPVAVATDSSQTNVPRSMSAAKCDSGLEQSLEAARAEIHRLRTENTRLQEKVFADMDSTLAGCGDTSIPADDPKMKSALIRSQRDVSILRSRLQQVTEENKMHLERIAQLEGGRPAADDVVEINRNAEFADERELGRLRKENERLRQEVQTLTIRLKQSAQMQELAYMLQESHKSLVQTNEHLLHELNETRRRLEELQTHSTNGSPLHHKIQPIAAEMR